MMILNKIAKLIKYSIFLLLLTLLVFTIIEGASSIILLTIDLFTPQKLPDSFHVQYDELLGWTNKPNIYIKDSYGPDIYFRTNSQSFRNDKDFTMDPPPGKIRIICSGDSNTLGVGVSNDNTWCQVLASIDEKLETINMGQGGYGIDQAYLWYMRDGNKFHHDIHIFAFIEDDFRRAKNKTFWGYQKPVFKLESDTLVLNNVPVPQSPPYVPKLTLASEKILEFRVVRLLKKIKAETGVQLLSSGGNDEQVRKLALKIFELLQKANKEHGSTLVTVYLPTVADYTKEVPWRKFLSVELAKKGIIFLDLTEDIKTQPVNLMFHGHYSEFGNKYLANLLYQKLLSMPEIKDKFAKSR